MIGIIYFGYHVLSQIHSVNDVTQIFLAELLYLASTIGFHGISQFIIDVQSFEGIDLT